MKPFSVFFDFFADPFRCLLEIINVLKFLSSLAIAVFLLQPLLLVHIQDDTGTVFKNDTIFISAQFNCRMPRSNVKVSEKDLTDAMYLPEGSLMFDQLYQVAKCKASTQKIGISSSDCFCMGMCIVYVCVAIAALASISNFVDCLWFAKKRTVSYTVVECQMCQRFVAFLGFLYLFVTIITVVHVEILAASFRYTPPNSVYDQNYYQYPLVWSTILNICLLQLLLAGIQCCIFATIIYRVINGNSDNRLIPAKSKFTEPQPLVDCAIVVELGKADNSMQIVKSADDKFVGCVVFDDFVNSPPSRKEYEARDGDRSFAI